MYLTLTSSAAAEIVVKKSRFLAVVDRANSEVAAREAIASARSSNPAAGHHCSAILVGDLPGNRIERCSDDGEPTGTAGGPMLAVLTGRDLTNVVAVVTRYFGGTELGTGGLARAYSDAVSTALDEARLSKRVRRELVRVEFDHSDAGRIEAGLRARGVDVVSIDYRARAVVTLAAADADTVRAVLASLTAGAAEPEPLGVTYVEIPVRS